MNFYFSRKIFFKCVLILATLSLTEGCTSKTLTKHSDGQAIDPIDLRRLEFARSSLEKINLDWHLEMKSLDQTCIVLFGDQQEWILNCADRLIPDSVAVSSFNGRPVYFTSKSLSIPKTTVPYAQLASSVVAQATVLTPYRLKETGLNVPPFILIQKLEDLVTHHPGFPKDTTKTEELLSIYTHEFFHIMQFTNPNVVQFIDTALENKCFVDQGELKKFYENNTDYQKSIKSEYDLLNAYLKNEKFYSTDSAKRVLSQWLTLYNKRINKYSASFAKKTKCFDLKIVDSFWAFAEGTARYVESQFLLNPEIRDGMENLKDDAFFGHFSSIKGSSYNALPSANKSLGATYYYAIGSRLSFILDIAAKNTWKQKTFTNPNWLIGAVESSVH